MSLINADVAVPVKGLHAGMFGFATHRSTGGAGVAVTDAPVPTTSPTATPCPAR